MARIISHFTTKLCYNPSSADDHNRVGASCKPIDLPCVEILATVFDSKASIGSTPHVKRPQIAAASRDGAHLLIHKQTRMDYLGIVTLHVYKAK